MRKALGFIARMYGLRSMVGRAAFLRAARGYRIRTPQPASKMCSHLLARGDEFARAAGITLASVSADPRNHFGKHALRRFDK